MDNSIRRTASSHEDCAATLNFADICSERPIRLAQKTETPKSEANPESRWRQYLSAEGLIEAMQMDIERAVQEKSGKSVQEINAAHVPAGLKAVEKSDEELVDTFLKARKVFQRIEPMVSVLENDINHVVESTLSKIQPGSRNEEEIKRIFRTDSLMFNLGHGMSDYLRREFQRLPELKEPAARIERLFDENIGLQSDMLRIKNAMNAAVETAVRSRYVLRGVMEKAGMKEEGARMGNIGATIEGHFRYNPLHRIMASDVLGMDGWADGKPATIYPFPRLSKPRE